MPAEHPPRPQGPPHPTANDPDHPINRVTFDHPIFWGNTYHHRRVQELLRDPSVADHPLIVAYLAYLARTAIPGPNERRATRDPNQPGGLEPSSPIRAPRVPTIPNEHGPISERNKENLPRAQLRALEERLEAQRIEQIARRTQLPMGVGAPASLQPALAALRTVGRGGLPTRNALIELEPRPDGRRRFRAMEDEEQEDEDENENRAPPTPLNRRDERTLAGGRPAVAPVATPGGIRARNNPDMEDLNPMDTGLPVDPLQRVVVGFRR
jgi:hypothetical protein